LVLSSKVHSWVRGAVRLNVQTRPAAQVMINLPLVVVWIIWLLNVATSLMPLARTMPLLDCRPSIKCQNAPLIVRVFELATNLFLRHSHEPCMLERNDGVGKLTFSYRTHRDDWAKRSHAMRSATSSNIASPNKIVLASGPSCTQNDRLSAKVMVFLSMMTAKNLWCKLRLESGVSTTLHAPSRPCRICVGSVSGSEGLQSSLS